MSQHLLPVVGPDAPEAIAASRAHLQAEVAGHSARMDANRHDYARYRLAQVDYTEAREDLARFEERQDPEAAARAHHDAELAADGHYFPAC